ncbi:MAG: lipoprotein [Hymenobacter sp.]|nr:lipoprotein [Hymenobacter sp.]
MKKLLLLAAVAVLGLSACNKTKCPAYTSIKAANRVSSPITAAVAPASAARQ